MWKCAGIVDDDDISAILDNLLLFTQKKGGGARQKECEDGSLSQDSSSGVNKGTGATAAQNCQERGYAYGPILTPFPASVKSVLRKTSVASVKSILLTDYLRKEIILKNVFAPESSVLSRVWAIFIFISQRSEREKAYTDLIVSLFE